MKRYRVAEARARFADLLDSAERGDPVVIERNGVRFTLQSEPGAAGRGQRRAVIEAADATVLEGRWTWTWRAGGLRFSRGRRRT